MIASGGRIEVKGGIVEYKILEETLVKEIYETRVVKSVWKLYIFL